MADTTFVDGTTTIVASWLNDVNDVTYTTVPSLQTAVNTTIPATYVAKDSNTGAASIPGGTTAQRPAFPSGTLFRYNTTLAKWEGYNGSVWEVIAGAAPGANNDITSLTALATVPTVVSNLITNSTTPGPRQTVRSGPVDSNGFAAFGGSTGSTTVTAAGTLNVTAANGILDRNGSITNPSWTGITANSWGTLTIAADGTCTTNVRTLKPIYQFGGTPSVTNGQLTFNIQEMKMYLGNGSTASAVYEVVVGRFAASGTVSAIVWYQLMGRYDSGFTATLPGIGTAISKNHYIGTAEVASTLVFECTTIDGGYAVGDRIVCPTTNASTNLINTLVWTTDEATGFSVGSSGGFYVPNKSTGGGLVLTAASWKYKIITGRTW